MIAHGLAHGGDNGFGVVHCRVGHLVPGNAKRIKLHGLIAAGDYVAGFGCKIIRRACSAVPPVCIRGQMVAGAAAQ